MQKRQNRSSIIIILAALFVSGCWATDVSWALLGAIEADNIYESTTKDTAAGWPKCSEASPNNRKNGYCIPDKKTQ